MKKILCFLGGLLLLCGCNVNTHSVANYANSFSEANRNTITMFHDKSMAYDQDLINYNLMMLTFSEVEILNDYSSDVKEFIEHDNNMRLIILKDTSFVFDADYEETDETLLNEDDLVFMLDNGATNIYVYYNGYIKIIDQTSDGINRYFYHTNTDGFNDNINKVITDIEQYYQLYSEL